MMSMFMVLMFGFYVYAFWIGSILIHDKRINPRTDKVYDVQAILTILMGIMMGMMVLMSMGPNI